MKSFRTDRMMPGPMRRLDNGFARFDMTVARSGILIYRLDDGTEWREYRPESECFAADSLETLKAIPITNDHPPELLNAQNAKQYAVGYTGESVSRADNFIASTGTLIDDKAISDMEAGKQEISAGYELDLEFAPGYFEGERYDAIQRSIRYNHVALVTKGRAGPGARVKIDSADQLRECRFDSFLSAADLKQRKGNERMDKTISLGGVEYKVSEAVESALLKRLRSDAETIENLQKELAAAKSNETKATARADALDADLRTAAEKLKSAESQRLDSAAINAAVQARVKLISSVTKFLPRADAQGAEIDYTAISDRDLKVQLIKKFDSKFDDKNKSDDYIDSRVDHILNTAKADEGEAGGEEMENEEEEEEMDGSSNKDFSGSVKEANDIQRRRAQAQNKREDKRSPEQIREEKRRADAEAWTKPIGFSRENLRK